MPKVVGTEWFNENSLRNYPLSQGATAQATNLDFSLPDSFLVDMKLFVPFFLHIHPTNFYVSSLTIYPQGLIFTIGYQDTDFGIDQPVIATSEPILFAGFQQFTTVAINGIQTTDSTVNFVQTYGLATIGSVEVFKALSGRIDLSLLAGRLESTVVSMGIRRISGIRVAASGSESGVLQGQVILRSGTNHEIKVVPVSGGSQLTFSAVSTSGFTESCGCNDVELGPPIRTINSLPPDSTGNFTLSAGDCVSVAGAGAGVVLSDTCAKPCCGCTELDVLNQDLDLLRTQVSTLSAFAGELVSQMQVLQTTALGSSFTPESCSSDSAGCGG